MTISAIAGAAVADEIRDAAKSDGGFEARRVPDNPV